MPADDATLKKAQNKYGLNGIDSAANLLPMMNAEEYEVFCDNIEATQIIHEPVIVSGEKLVIDGRNRLCASIDTGIDVEIRTLNPEDPMEYVLSKNIPFRKISTLQKAKLGSELKKKYEKEARERQQQAGGDRKSEEYRSSLPPDSGEAVSGIPSKKDGESIVKAAKVVGVGAETLRKYEKIVKEAPELIETIEQGHLSIDAAANQLSRTRAQQPSSGDREKRGSEPELTDDIVPQTNQEEGHSPKKQQQTSSVTDEHEHQVLQEEAREKAKTGKTIILRGLNKSQQEIDVEYPEPKSKQIFNRTTESIGWAWWSWNPVTGCLHGCEYCYARQIANNKKHIFPTGFDPLFRHIRLDAPKDSMYPDEDKGTAARNVFVCSMSDLFGAWVPADWTESVLEVCRNNPRWNYLMLTKNPERYHEFDLPESVWAGATVDSQKRVERTVKVFQGLEGPKVRWISFEPLLEDIEIDLTGIDWVVIGAQSGTIQPDGTKIEAKKPDHQWVRRLISQAEIAGCAVFCKNNLMGKPTDHKPGMALEQEMPKMVK